MHIPDDKDRLVMLDDILLSRKDTLIDSISIDSEFIFSNNFHCNEKHIHQNVFEI